MTRVPFGILAGVLAGLGLVGKIWLDGHEVKAPLSRRLHLKPVAASYEGKALKRASLGFRNLVADLLWVKLLQGAEHTPLQENTVSWEYAQLQAITTLDPHFDKAFDFGAAYLSVFRRDKQGARLLLEEWAKRRPQYWRTHYLLGYHLYFEMGEYELASKHILKAAGLEKAPGFLSSLGVRLLSEAGGLWQALELAIEMYPNLSDLEGRVRLQKRIRSIRFALEQARWAEALQKFREQHHQEPRDLLALAPYLSQVGRDISALEEETLELASVLREKFSFQYDRASKSIVSVRSEQELGIDRTGVYRPNSG